jgi:hypothetical protein
MCRHFKIVLSGIFLRKMSLSIAVSVKSRIETAERPEGLRALMQVGPRQSPCGIDEDGELILCDPEGGLLPGLFPSNREN